MSNSWFRIKAWAAALAATLMLAPSVGSAGIVSTLNGDGSVTLTATSGVLSAQATFKVSGTDLNVYFVNTSSTVVSDPANALTAIMFDLAGNPALTGGTAFLHAGSVVLNAPSVAANGTTPLTGGTVGGSGDVGGEFAFVHNVSGLGSGLTQHYGISNSGLGPFGPGDLLDNETATAINLSGPASPDGRQYEQVGTAGTTLGDIAIKNGVDIVLHGLASGFTLTASSFTNVRFQFGTDLADPKIFDPDLPEITPDVTPVPEPAAIAVWGLLSLVGVAYGRRRKVA